MILGMIELLTARQARGWARATDDSSIPLTIRVRVGETVLVQVDPEPSARMHPDVAEGDGRAQVFEIQFPAVLKQDEVAKVAIEAGERGSGAWHPLPRHLRVGGVYAHNLPVLPLNGDIKSHATQELARSTSAQLPFWSDVPAGPSFDGGGSYPVFVLGSARSGTTALSLAMSKATKYQGFPEGHVLDVGIRLHHAMNGHFEKKDPWIDPSARAAFQIGRLSHARFHSEVIQVLRRLASGYTTPHWFDKTPTFEMVASAPILAHAWPNARFIFMKRRGLENVQSRIRKFARSNFAGSCRDWNLIMAGWRTVRQSLEGKFIEIDQHYMAEDPDLAAEGVGSLLHLEASEIETFASVLRRVRPESTGPADNIVSELAELNWPPENIESFREICGAEMAAYGYTYDSRYCC
jgi:hypothetical protein